MRIFCVLPADVHLLDITGPAQVFYEAKEYGAELELVFLQMSGEAPIVSSAGLGFAGLTSFREVLATSEDYIFLPGLDFELLSNRTFLQQQAEFFTWLKTQKEKGARICSVCTGAFLLAEAGLLNGVSCTTHWKYLQEFKDRFPQAVLLDNRLFVEDEGICTSAGVSSGLDLALYLIEQEFGSRITTQVAKELVLYMRRTPDDPQLSIFLQYRNHIDWRIHALQDYIAGHLEQTLTLELLAEQVFTSSRSLTRSFKQATGMTVGAYIKGLRKEKAQQLIAQGHKQDFVATSCGLKTRQQLHQLLK